MRSAKVRPWGNVSGGINARSNAYEGASQSYRMQQKGMGGGGPNASISYSLRTLRDRSRHAVRNNAYATRATESYVSNMVGTGIKAKFANPELQALWRNWLKICDKDGNENFAGLQALIIRGQFESGEVLCRLHVSRGFSNDVPLRLQVIESDYLDESLNRETSTRSIKMGVEFDRAGRRRKYHLWKNHPQDMGGYNERIEVSAADVLHIYRTLRPGQIRGIPESSSVLVRLYEIDEMQDATLVRQKTAALFGWIVRKRESGEPYVPGTPAGTVGANGSVVAADDGEREMLTKITPGGIHYLEDDEDIEFSQPADIASIYAEYLKTELHAVAAGWGVTYEQLTGDLSGVNYSSIRAGLIEFRRRIELLQETLLIYKFCDKVADRWLRLAVISGLAPSNITLNSYKDHLPSWQSPRWDWVDPLKDAQADLLEVRAGFSTRSAKQLERGNDPDETDEKLIQEQASNLHVDSDPSKLTKAGQDQDRSTRQSE